MPRRTALMALLVALILALTSAWPLRPRALAALHVGLRRQPWRSPCWPPLVRRRAR